MKHERSRHRPDALNVLALVAIVCSALSVTATFAISDPVLKGVIIVSASVGLAVSIVAFAIGHSRVLLTGTEDRSNSHA